MPKRRSVAAIFTNISAFSGSRYVRVPSLRDLFVALCLSCAAYVEGGGECRRWRGGGRVTVMARQYPSIHCLWFFIRGGSDSLICKRAIPLFCSVFLRVYLSGVRRGVASSLLYRRSDILLGETTRRQKRDISVLVFANALWRASPEDSSRREGMAHGSG